MAKRKGIHLSAKQANQFTHHLMTEGRKKTGTAIAQHQVFIFVFQELNCKSGAHSTRFLK